MSKAKLVRVPTLPELAERGLARIVGETEKGAPTHYRPKKKGAALIAQAQAHNARVMREAETRVAEARAAVREVEKPLRKAEEHRRSLMQQARDLQAERTPS